MKTNLKSTETFILSCISIACILALFANIEIMPEYHYISKWHLSLFFFLLFCLCICFLLPHDMIILPNKQKVFHYFSLSITICSCILSCQGLGQSCGFITNNTPFSMTGSFDNPVGLISSLCINIPFITYTIRKDNMPLIKYSALTTLFLLICCIILSGSRTGILTLLLIGMILLNDKYKLLKLKKHYIICGVFCIPFLIGLYYLKKDSADGRLLIWKCAWNMFKEKPLVGYGPGGFQANYMNFQADYFKEHPNNDFAKLADNINYPFNEYIKVLINHGLIGFIISTILIASIFHLYKLHRCLETQTSGLSLLAIGVFSLSSYPFSYIYIWIILLISIYTILSWNRTCITIRNKTIFRILICMPMLCGIWYIGKRIQTQYVWGKIAEASLKEQTEKLFIEYKQLLPQLKRNRYFLYNYAVELHYANRYKESNDIAKLCKKVWADYDLELLMGDNYFMLKNYELAKSHFEHAAYMCPVRFTPIYKLFKIYKEMNDIEKASQIAKLIIKKTIKIDSIQIQYMISEAAMYLSIEEMRLNNKNTNY